MEITIYQSPKDFLKEQEAYLLQRESVSQLLLYNAINLAKEENDTLDTHIFGKVEHNNEIQYLFCNVLPFNLLIYTEKKEVIKEAVELLVNYLMEHQIIINGINARAEICNHFIELYKTKSGHDFIQYLAMDIMELSNLSRVELAKGYTRLATLEDVKLITKWKCEFALEALNEVLEPELVMERVHKQIEADIYYLFVNEKNEIVSMASPSRKLIQGISINAVYTPKDYRNHNYAMTNMYHLCKQMLHDGNKFVSLFVDKTNPISNRVYKKIGFEIIEDNYDYRILTKTI